LHEIQARNQLYLNHVIQKVIFGDKHTATSQLIEPTVHCESI